MMKHIQNNRLSSFCIFGFLSLLAPPIYGTSSAFAPSFDCSVNLKPVEQTICNDKYLSEIDIELNEIFQFLLKRVDSKDELIQSQRQWLSNRNQSSDTDDIKFIYWKRIEELLSLLKYEELYYNTIVARESCGYASNQLLVNACNAKLTEKRKATAIERLVGSMSMDSSPNNANRIILENYKIDPSCFQFEWLSSDNFKAISTYYNLERKTLSERPGELLGSSITTPDPIPFYGSTTYALTPQLSGCSGHPEKIKFDLAPGETEPEHRTPYWSYDYLGVLSETNCSKLFPSLPNSCELLFVIEYEAYSGGSHYSPPEVGVFGIINWNGKRVIAPALYSDETEK